MPMPPEMPRRPTEAAQPAPAHQEPSRAPPSRVVSMEVDPTIQYPPEGQPYPVPVIPQAFVPPPPGFPALDRSPTNMLDYMAHTGPPPIGFRQPDPIAFQPQAQLSYQRPPPLILNPNQQPLAQ
jgi:hypothetical protein